MPTPNLSRATVVGQAAAERFAARLVAESCWFGCDPCPDDVWQFEVKPDRRASLARAMGAAHGIAEMREIKEMAEPPARVCPNCGSTDVLAIAAAPKEQP